MQKKHIYKTAVAAAILTAIAGTIITYLNGEENDYTYINNPAAKDSTHSAQFASRGTLQSPRPPSFAMWYFPVSDQIALSFSDELAAKLKTEKGRDYISKYLSKHAGLSLIYTRQVLPNVHIIKINNLNDGQPNALDTAGQKTRMNEILTKLASLPGIIKAEEDMLMFPSSLLNDPRFEDQWFLRSNTFEIGAINATEAWEKSTGKEVVVAILDTGITDHPDLNDNVLPGYDFIHDVARSGDGDGWDSNAHDEGDFVTAAEALTSLKGCPAVSSSWHGTHVAGIVGAIAKNHEGGSGVSPDSKILPVRVLGKCGGYASDIAAGIYWASGSKTFNLAPQNPNPAQIINLSLGGYGSCPFFYSAAISMAKKAGSTIIVAAGNNNNDASKIAPANCAGVIAVAAVGKTGNRSAYSNFGNKISVSAPGGDSARDGENQILSTINTGLTTPSVPGYAFYQGTSMATPVMSGTVALTMSARPGITSADAANIVISKAEKFSPDSDCFAGGCGAGIINALNAVGHAASIGSDLSVELIRLTDDALIPSIPTYYTLKIMNRGNITAIGDLTIKTYLSANKILDDSAILLDELIKPIKIAAGGITQISANNISAPKNTIDGNYYLHVSLVPSTSIMEQIGADINNVKSTASLPVATPQITIKKRVSTTQAPSLVSYSFAVTPSALNRRVMKSDFKKTWSFSGDAPSKISTYPTINFLNPGTHTATVNIDHNAGFNLNTVDVFENTEPTPFVLTLNRRTTNKLHREPFSASYSISYSDGHPQDRVAQIAWSINDEPPIIKPFFTLNNIMAGEHKIKVVMTSRHGVITSAEDFFTVIPNQAPTCNLIGTNNTPQKQAVFTVNCTDPDGRIKSYEWFINGNKTSAWNTTYKLNYTGSGSIVASVKVTDDGGAVVINNYTFNH